MKATPLFCIIVSFVFATAVFAQTAEMTGTVVAVSRGTITIQNGTDQWTIQRVPSTKVTGDLTVGKTVTVSYNQPDAQKKEVPLGGTPTAAPQ